MNPVYVLHGVGDLLEVYDGKVAITPKGALGFLAKGLKGTKTIPFSSISAIQLKKAGVLVNGYIQFTIPGGNESRGGAFEAGVDENTCVFAKSENDLAIKIKDYIEDKMEDARARPSNNLGQNIAEEIGKLAKLRDEGVLSEDEFKAAKIRLIS